MLATADAREKAAAALSMACDQGAGLLADDGFGASPDRPARPDRPALVPPASVVRRRVGAGVAGRVALLHALAHIELNAIDLAADLVARFGQALTADERVAWVGVAAEEASHFLLLDARLSDLGAGYGDLPAHDGLWEAAMDTRDDLAARLAVVPMVLEARGLDVTPAMAEQLLRVGDAQSAAVLERILADEVGHVALGLACFRRVVTAAGGAPEAVWPALVHRYFRGRLKPPFNDDARARAGFGGFAYAGLAEM